MRPTVVVVLVSALAIAGCSDSALTGPPLADRDATTDADDATDADVTPQRCESDEECRNDTVGPCEIATCHPTLGVCRVAQRADCCNSNDDCPQVGAACLEGQCPFPGSSCIMVNTCEGCRTATDCEAIAPPCATSSCVEGQCRFAEDTACCSDDSDCNDNDLCTNDRCVEGRCTATHRCDTGQCPPDGACCAGPVAFQTSFEPAPPWEARTSNQSVRWQVLRSDNVPTPPAAMYLGNAERRAFVGDAAGVRADVSFDLGVLVPGQTAEVRFRILADIPGNQTTTGLSVFLQTPGTRINIPRIASSKTWTSVTHKADIAAPGPWRLVFEYNGALARDASFFGIAVDDLDVRHGCGGEVIGCQSDRECAVDDPCTLGLCADGTCFYRPNPICQSECLTNRECEDGDPCTENLCDAGTCETRLSPDCEQRCQTSRDCEDGDACTINTCESGLCRTRTSPNCPERCTSDRECEDGIACTFNFCADGTCVALGGPDCCASDDDCEDGDACTRDFCAPDGICIREPAGPECGCNSETCNDGDPCTIDSCDAAGRCVHRQNTTDPNCQVHCTLDRDCADGRACTVDRCRNGVCRYETLPNCCDRDSACDDDDDCTTDFCEADTGRCANIPNPNCGCGALNCDDGDPCTTDICVEGGCLHFPDPSLPGCGGECRSDGDCNDGRRCTTDRCVQGQCRNAPVAGCCETNAACDDGDSCTLDRCTNNRCTYTESSDCNPCPTDACDDNDPCTIDVCLDDGRCQNFFDTTSAACRCRLLNCDDNDPCTADFCEAGQCQHRPTPEVPGCVDPDCTSNGDCDDGDACTVDRCTSTGRCDYAPSPNCLCTDASCDDGDPCTKDACVNGDCVHERDTTLPGCGPNSCRSDADCNDGNSCTINVCDADLGCLSIDRNGASCNDNNACTQGDRCVGSACTAGTAINCDDRDPCTADACDPTTGACTHRAITGPGCGPPCGGTCNDGNPCTTDACDAATDRCVFTPIGSCCQQDVDCADGHVCTTDSCRNNQCSNVPVSSNECNPDRCQRDTDCADGLACTTDRCDLNTGECTNTPTADCCQTDADCNDSSACTVDVCVPSFGICVNANVPCNDNDPCTFDSCDPNNGCVFRPDPACECQPEILWSRNFATTETPDIQVEGGFTVTWYVDNVRFQSAPRAFRFGDADGENYDTGSRVAGRATGPSIAIPEDSIVTLNFNVWLDIDATAGEDSFVARVVSGNRNVVVWSRESVPVTAYRSWIPVSVAIPATFAGSNAQIRFVFDSVNGNGNEGQGVFLDDIVVKTTCAP